MAENPLIGRRGLSHLSVAFAWAPLGLTLALAAGALAFGRELVQVVDETMRPAGLSVWLREGARE